MLFSNGTQSPYPHWSPRARVRSLQWQNVTPFGAGNGSLSQNARAVALLNMPSNDSLIVAFWTKYHYNVWRPETAIFEGSLDGNPKTDGDATFTPYVVTPC